MYLAYDERPTQCLRFKKVSVTQEISGVLCFTEEICLQQKWVIRDNFKTHYEWRDIPKVGSDEPDIEPYDENPNLGD